MVVDEKGMRESNQYVLNTLEVCISLMILICMGDVGAVGITDEAAMGYYLVKWLSKPYTLQENTEGMDAMIGAGIRVIKRVYYTRVKCAPYWYMLLGMRTVFEMRHVLWIWLQLLEICSKNKLHQLCGRMEATWQKREASFNHDRIMKESGRHGSTMMTRRATMQATRAFLRVIVNATANSNT